MKQSIALSLVLALSVALQHGKKVEFEFVQQGKDNVITAVK